MTVKTYLAFGDSNTHGSVPSRDPTVLARHPAGIRWPSVALTALGTGWALAEEGLPGRTTQFPDPVMGDHMDGRTGLKIALMTHAPVALVSIMLGTNDVKTRFGATPDRIAAGLAGLLDILRMPEMMARTGNPKVLVIAPPPVAVVGVRMPEWQGAEEKARALAPLYARVAAGYDAGFLDAGAHIAVSAEEGIHWTAEAHRRFGAAAGAALAALVA